MSITGINLIRLEHGTGKKKKKLTLPKCAGIFRKVCFGHIHNDFLDLHCHDACWVVRQLFTVELKDDFRFRQSKSQRQCQIEITRLFYSSVDGFGSLPPVIFLT